MNTQATAPAAKKTSRKAAAAAKFSDAAQALQLAATEDNAAPVVTAAAPVDPAKVGTGLTKAKAARTKASRAVVVKVDGGATETEQMAAAVNTLQAKAAAASKRKAKKEEPEFVPVVVSDENKHTAIAVASNGRTVELIPMDSAGLSVTRLSRDRFAAEYKPMPTYPVSKAAKVYLTQTIGMDPKAKAVLEVLAAAEADKPIASGELVALMSKHDEAAVQTVPANGDAPAAAAPKAARAKAPKADREGKPTGSRASAAEQAKKIVAGDVTVGSKVQPGSFRAARHEYIVSMAGKTVAEVLGAATVEGKRGIAYRDIQFAVSHGFIKLA